VHFLQLANRFYRRDFLGASRHFAEGLSFFDDPEFRQRPAAMVSAFAVASWNAWMIGRPALARDRESRMMAAAGAKQAL
jgi:hypothetical protein